LRGISQFSFFKVKATIGRQRLAEGETREKLKGKRK
jgi:hypothetical protein